MFPRYTVLHRNESLDIFVTMVVVCNVSPLETFLELHSLKILLRILLLTSIINIFKINKCSVIFERELLYMCIQPPTLQSHKSNRKDVWHDPLKTLKLSIRPLNCSGNVS